MKNRLLVLMEEKSLRDGKRIRLHNVHKDTLISRYTLRRIANNELKNYPSDVVQTLCNYFDCQPGDLLYIDESENESK